MSDEDIAAVRAATRERMRVRRYDNRGDDWGRGYFGDASRSVYVGFVGEWAFSNAVLANLGIRCPVDTSPRRRGDGDIDFDLCGYRVQVKTAASRYDDLLVRCHNACAPAEELQVRWDVCVRMQWPTRNPRPERDGAVLFRDGSRLDYSAADVCGVVWASDFPRVSTIRRGRGTCEWNYVVAPENLVSVATLWDLCKARLLRGERDGI